MKILILSGGMHPFHQTTPILIHSLIEHGFEVNLTEDPNYLLTYDMTKYDALIFNTRRVEELTLSNEQQKALTNYVANGKGFVAIHVGAGLPESWPEYHDLTGGGWVYGGTSAAHPPSKHTVTIADNSHPCAKGLKDFEIDDEIYMKVGWRPDNDIFLSTNCEGEIHPTAWSRKYKKGKVVTTNLGHYGPAFKSTEFQKMIINSIYWVTS
jgi:type 1 glutamine amidotransferase